MAKIKHTETGFLDDPVVEVEVPKENPVYKAVKLKRKTTKISSGKSFKKLFGLKKITRSKK